MSELGIERINDRAIDVAVDGSVPALRAVGVERKKLAQVLPEVVGAVAPNVGRREDIVRVGRLEGPKQVAIGRISPEWEVHAAVGGNRRLARDSEA